MPGNARAPAGDRGDATGWDSVDADDRSPPPELAQAMPTWTRVEAALGRVALSAPRTARWSTSVATPPRLRSSAGSPRPRPRSGGLSAQGPRRDRAHEALRPRACGPSDQPAARLRQRERAHRPDRPHQGRLAGRDPERARRQCDRRLPRRPGSLRRSRSRSTTRDHRRGQRPGPARPTSSRTCSTSRSGSAPARPMSARPEARQGNALKDARLHAVRPGRPARPHADRGEGRPARHRDRRRPHPPAADRRSSGRARRYQDRDPGHGRMAGFQHAQSSKRRCLDSYKSPPPTPGSTRTSA